MPGANASYQVFELASGAASSSSATSPVSSAKLAKRKGNNINRGTSNDRVEIGTSAPSASFSPASYAHHKAQEAYDRGAAERDDGGTVGEYDPLLDCTHIEEITTTGEASPARQEKQKNTLICAK